MEGWRNGRKGRRDFSELKFFTNTRFSLLTLISPTIGRMEEWRKADFHDAQRRVTKGFENSKRIGLEERGEDNEKTKDSIFRPRVWFRACNKRSNDSQTNLGDG